MTSDPNIRAILEVSGLVAGYGERRIAEDISFSVKVGEVCVMMGENGAGKSTILKSVTGEIPILDGEIYIDGHPLKEYGKRELARTMSLVTTDKGAAGGLRVRELVGLGRHPYSSFMGRIGKEDIEIVEKSLRDVGVIHKSGEYVSDLSDGERQKCMIARALAQETKLIVLDEPFSFLDVGARIVIFNLLKRIAKERKIAVLLSSHDVSQSMRLADRVFILSKGRLYEGSPKEIVENGVINFLFPDYPISYDKKLMDFVEK